MKRKNKGRPATEVARENKSKLAAIEGRIANIESWAMGQIRANNQQGEHLDKLTTVAVLLIKEALGMTLSEEEVAALKEAVGEGSGSEAVQGVDGKAAPVDGDGAGVADQSVANPE